MSRARRAQLERLQAEAGATRDAIRVVGMAIPAAVSFARTAEAKLSIAKAALERLRAENRAIRRNITWGTLGMPSGLSCVVAVLSWVSLVYVYAVVRGG